MTPNYSMRQLRAFQSAATTSGLLSFIGSSLILFHAIHKRHSIQHRILMGLSAFDLISSLGNIIFPFAYMSHNRTPGIDCTVETSMQLLGIGAILYNLALSIYYVLCIVCLFQQQRIVKYWEPFLHTVCICFPLACVIAGLALNVANPNVYHFGCHSNAFPRSCDEPGSQIECERGGNGRAFRFLIGSTVVPILTTWAGLFINSTIIVLSVYRQEQKKARYDPSVPSSPDGVTKRVCCSSSVFLSQSNPSLSYKMARQALQWVGCFSLTYTMPLIVFCISIVDLEGAKRGDYFPLVFLLELCWPLQGFFDAIVYFRPRYILWRTNGSLSRPGAVWWTVLSLQPAPTRPQQTTAPTAEEANAISAPTEDTEGTEIVTEGFNSV